MHGRAAAVGRLLARRSGGEAGQVQQDPTEYKSAGSAWQRAYGRAFGKPKPRLGLGSARKSMSQWLSEAGYSWFQIKDIGGWSINDIMRKGHYIKMTIAEALEIKRDFFARLRARYAARP